MAQLRAGDGSAGRGLAALPENLDQFLASAGCFTAMCNSSSRSDALSSLLGHQPTSGAQAYICRQNIHTVKLIFVKSGQTYWRENDARVREVSKLSPRHTTYMWTT